jgi:hypothetical protein
VDNTARPPEEVCMPAYAVTIVVPVAGTERLDLETTTSQIK